jgi:hypothetical protein
MSYALVLFGGNVMRIRRGKSHLTSYLEGQNIGELNQMAQDGDVRHLGVVGRNLQLIGVYERSQAESEAFERQREIEDAARREEESRRWDEIHAQRMADDRQRAVYLTSLRNAPQEERFREIPDSDAAVDSFLSSF